MARPRIYDADDLAIKMDEYTLRTDNPTIVGFCVEQNMSKDTLYRLEKENAELSDAIKRLATKSEAYIVKITEEGKTNPVFSIFRLKQKRHGWTDKQEIDLDAKVAMPSIKLGK